MQRWWNLLYNTNVEFVSRSELRFKSEKRQTSCLGRATGVFVFAMRSWYLIPLSCFFLVYFHIGCLSCNFFILHWDYHCKVCFYHKPPGDCQFFICFHFFVSLLKRLELVLSCILYFTWRFYFHRVLVHYFDTLGNNVKYVIVDILYTGKWCIDTYILITILYIICIYC